jgi:uncharacterized protein YodC (DUF2158 family)
MPKFKVGETCRLNSGGPLMTVKSYGYGAGHDDKPHVNTIYFDKEDKECSGKYPEEMLSAIKRETFHGMTHREVWRNYEAWRGPRSHEIVIVKVHPMEAKLAQDHLPEHQRTKPNAYSMVVEWMEKPD